jgi:hypothetical protein
LRSAVERSKIKSVDPVDNWSRFVSISYQICNGAAVSQGARVLPHSSRSFGADYGALRRI